MALGTQEDGFFKDSGGGSGSGIDITINEDPFASGVTESPYNIPVVDSDATPMDGSKVGDNWEIADNDFQTFFNGTEISSGSVPAAENMTFKVFL
jgi:hypothetical protein